MNVLLITSTYPTPLRPRQGAFNESMVAALRERNRVHVLSPIPWTQARLGRRSRNMSGEDVDYPISFYPPKILRQRYGGFLWRSIRPTVGRLAKRFRPDAVVGYWLHPDGEAALRAAEYFQVPGIVISGGSDLHRLPATPSRRRAVCRVLSAADRVVVVSDDLRRRAISLGAQPDQVELIRRGVQRDLFYPVDPSSARVAAGLPGDAIVLLWAGRLEPVKNPAMLLYAAREWKRRWGNRLRVLMYGDGSMRSEIQSLRRQLQLQDVVQLESAVSQTELALRYKAANLTVLTSHSEGVPNVLLESIACGIPFAATNVGGVGEIATPGLDALVGDGNIQQLVEAVVQQIECAATRRHVVTRQFIPADIGQSAEQLEALIQQLIHPSGQRVVPIPTSGFTSSTLSAWTEVAG